MRTIFFIGVIVVAIGVLLYIGHQSVSTRAVPSLGEYVASSTTARVGNTSETASVWMASSTIVRILLSELATSSDPSIIPTSSASIIPPTAPTPKVQSVAAPSKAPSRTSPPQSTLGEGYIRAPGGKIRVLIAKTPATRERGLGGYASLPEDQGMLFIFPKPTTVSFWMENMHFPIDIVWMNSDRKILGITRDVSPDTFPKSFPSPGKIQFVLELNAGGAEKFGLKKGLYLSI